ncbi:dihydrofolate reductase family protein [Speluncibacter jeojiensis]|uniref:dihydrofolate reductase family protein n=1 Tax=Speluncibacter jeojiensis TaxID=2710754 RepID=UPI002FCCD8A6
MTWSRCAVRPKCSSSASSQTDPGARTAGARSWELARTLHHVGVVDEYRLLVFPVTVGPGKRLFGPGSSPAQQRGAHETRGRLFRWGE